MWLLNFDWISPLLAILGDIFRGGGFTFLIPATCGWTGREIARLLRRRGVQSWGLMIINRTFTITVPKGQARYAAQILLQAGLPLESIPAGTVIPSAPPAPRSRGEAVRQQSFITCAHCGNGTSERGNPTKCATCGARLPRPGRRF